MSRAVSFRDRSPRAIYQLKISSFTNKCRFTKQLTSYSAAYFLAMVTPPSFEIIERPLADFKFSS